MPPIIRNFKITLIVLIVLGIAMTECGKKTTKSAENLLPPQPKAPIQQFMPDTSESTSFRAAKLDSILAAQARDSLRTIHFDFDKSDLKPEAIDLLAIAGKFLMNHPFMRVLIAGNCDDRGSSDYNMALGLRRAQAAREYLVAYGVKPIQIEITSYGKEQLLVYGCKTEECHAKNRRDDFTVISSSGKSVSFFSNE